MVQVSQDVHSTKLKLTVTDKSDPQEAFDDDSSDAETGDFGVRSKDSKPEQSKDLVKPDLATAVEAPAKPSDDIHKTFSQLQAELERSNDSKPGQSMDLVKLVDIVKPQPSLTRASMQSGFTAIQQDSAAYAGTEAELDFQRKLARLPTITKPAARTDEAAKLAVQKIAADFGILPIPDGASYAGHRVYTLDHQ